MLEFLVRVVGVLVAFLVTPLLVGQAEHKVMAHMQSRLGPMYAGAFHGWAQLVADGVKFVQKESVTPPPPTSASSNGRRSSRSCRTWRRWPRSRSRPASSAPTSTPGVFFVLAVMSVGVLGSLMAGWASGNKYSLLGGLRVAAQLMSYELPFVLSAASVAVAAGTLSLSGIVHQWNPWWLLWQLPGLVVFFIAGLAELQRPPFDMPVADSEVIFGPYTEYTGLRFAMFLLAEYAGIVVLAGLTTVLFLGGWSGPGPDSIGWIWTVLKAAVVSLLVIWIRVAFPRMRADQLQKLAWQGLVPLALLQLALTGIGVAIFY